MLGLVSALTGVHCSIIDDTALFVSPLLGISVPHCFFGFYHFMAVSHFILLFSSARLLSRAQLSAAWHRHRSLEKTEKRKQNKSMKEFSWVER